MRNPHCKGAPKMYQEEFGYSWRCYFRRKCKESCQEGIQELIDTDNELRQQREEDMQKEIESISLFIGMGGTKEDKKIAGRILE